MRVFITGGAGLIGGAASAHLIERGHETVLTDIAPEVSVPSTIYAACDIMDFDSVFEQMRGCDSVVHMAALRSPLNGPGHKVFSINTAGTFNVFEAAAKHGIKRVVQASSINAIGCAWNVGDFTPQYFPVDEAHPQDTSDPYSFSKQQIEDIGDYYWRREKIASVALRFPGVWDVERRKSGEWDQRFLKMRTFLEEFSALPAAEQQKQLTEARQQCLAYRANRRMEFPQERLRINPKNGLSEVLLNAYTFDRFNLWTALDVRDAALSIELSLTAPIEGSLPLFINEPLNTLNYASEKLAHLFFPEVTERKHPINGSESLVSMNRARELIGFEPQYPISGDQYAETR